jgi:hypothetical protein
MRTRKTDDDVLAAELRDAIDDVLSANPAGGLFDPIHRELRPETPGIFVGYVVAFLRQVDTALTVTELIDALEELDP